MFKVNSKDTKSTNCLSLFDHFVGLALKGLKLMSAIFYFYFFLPNDSPSKTFNYAFNFI